MAPPAVYLMQTFTLLTALSVSSVNVLSADVYLMRIMNIILNGLVVM